MDNRFQLSSEGSNAIALIRMIACFSIVACHFLQAYGSGWAYVFNVGVQIFFMMSGFLYGVFGIKSVRKFYTKRFKKIYWPYLLWTCIIGALLLLVNRDIVTIKLFIAQVFMYYTLPGQEHLWFMFVLFICYIIVPIFEIIKNPKLSLIVLSACILIFTTCFIYTEKADYLWYAIYFIGYGIGRYKYLAYSFGLLATMSFMYATSITRSLSAYRGGNRSHIACLTSNNHMQLSIYRYHKIFKVDSLLKIAQRGGKI